MRNIVRVGLLVAASQTRAGEGAAQFLAHTRVAVRGCRTERALCSVGLLEPGACDTVVVDGVESTVFQQEAVILPVHLLAPPFILDNPCVLDLDDVVPRLILDDRHWPITVACHGDRLRFVQGS